MRTTPHDARIIADESREEIADALAGLIVGLDDAAELVGSPPAGARWRRYETEEGIALVHVDELVTVYTGATADRYSARALEVMQRAEMVALRG